MTTSRDCYEAYWESPQEAPPATDPLRGERLALLEPYLKAEDRLLDVGCGDGRVLELLHSRHPRAVGVDISWNALREAKQRVPTGRWACAALERELPFADASFDVALFFEVIEHLLDVPTALRALHRVLRPGGLLYLSTPYHGLAKNLALAALAFDHHFDPVGPHIRFFTVRSLTRLLRQAGFRVERHRCLGRFWPVWMDMAVWARKE